MAPKVAGIDVPPLRHAQLSQRQLDQMTPFERDTVRRLDGHDKEIHGVREAVEGLGKQIENHQRDTASRAAAAAKRAAFWAWIRTAVVTPTVITAAIAALSTAWTERIKADAVNKVQAKTEQSLQEKTVRLEERATLKAEDLARAILDEQEWRERQRPINRDPDVVTSATNPR